MRTTIHQQTIQGQAVSEEKIVDELCSIIRKCCSLKEFVFYCKHLLNEEQTITDKEEDLDVRMNFDVVGAKGWNCLHAACSAGNTEVAEFLILKK